MTTGTTKRVIGMRLRRAGSLAYYDPGDLEVAVGDAVVIDTSIGPDVGTVAIAPHALVHRDPLVPVRPTLRLATDDDHGQREALKVREAEALVLARGKARNLDLQMKISAARISLDERKLVLDFTAGERLDLRPLYRKLSEALNTRVELRAVGPRDEAKNIGGLGRCGLQTCCSSWLTKFASITVRMAKEPGAAGERGRPSGTVRAIEMLPSVRVRAVPGSEQASSARWGAGHHGRRARKGHRRAPTTRDGVGDTGAPWAG